MTNFQTIKPHYTSTTQESDDTHGNPYACSWMLHMSSDSWMSHLHGTSSLHPAGTACLVPIDQWPCIFDRPMWSIAMSGKRTPLWPKSWPWSFCFCSFWEVNNSNPNQDTSKPWPSVSFFCANRPPALSSAVSTRITSVIVHGTSKRHLRSQPFAYLIRWKGLISSWRRQFNWDKFSPYHKAS